MVAQSGPPPIRSAGAVIAATMTRAETAGQAALLERALRRLADGRGVAVADGGSSDAFLAALDALPGVTRVASDGAGLVGQIKGSLQFALKSGAASILYTEPDKEDFFARGLDGFLRAAAGVEGAGVVLAARSAASYATFPEMQRYTEGVINTLCGHYTGVAGDYSYGPFLIDRRLVPHVLSMADDAGWGWRPFVFALAARLGLPVTLLEGDYPCPPDQRAEDASERLHRIRQLQQNLRGLVLAQSVQV
jgi:hypothetical protein